MTPRLPRITTEQAQRDALAHERNRRLAAALLAGASREELASRAAPAHPGPPVPAKFVNSARRLIPRDEALKSLFPSRKSVKAAPVEVNYQPQHVQVPIVFKWKVGQRLSRLSRPVSGPWAQVLTGVSTTFVAGGGLRCSQGLNLIRIIEEVRKRCFLRVGETGRPVQVREQVVLIVEEFAAACGMSVATFYRALRHPLAHLFLRTQKVQRKDEQAEARRNVATLFTVSMFEPDMPAELEDEYFAQPVEQDGIFIVPDYNSQFERTKERPLTTLKQETPVENSVAEGGRSSPAAQDTVFSWMDGAALGTKRADGLDPNSAELESCLDRLRVSNPALWELATQIAIIHDAKDLRGVAAIGYYKALIHLGQKTVRNKVQCVQRWMKQGQNIDNPGAVVMALLNREARKLTSFEIHDLGTEKGQVLA